MSWSIENPEETELLATAVERALKERILLFCASNDQGNLTDNTYPSRICPEKIFKIGSATHLGHRENTAQRNVDFVAPGVESAIQSIHGDDIGFSGLRSGSSIATARCAGIAAAILQCIMLCQEDHPKDHVRTHANMTQMLKKLVDEGDRHCYLRPWKVFKEAMRNAKMEDEYEWNVIRIAARVFMGTTELLSRSGTS